MNFRPNYRAYNPELDKDCGHNHHSPQSATACALSRGWEGVAKIIKVSRGRFKKNHTPLKPATREIRAQNSPQEIKKKRQAVRKKRYETGAEKRIIPVDPIILPKKEQPKAKVHPIDHHRDMSYFEDLLAYSPYFPDWMERPIDQKLLDLRARAGAGDAYSQFRMGLHYEENRISCTKAVYWYSLSSKNRCSLATEALCRLFWSEDGECVSDTIERQLQGNGTDLMALGMLNMSGMYPLSSVNTAKGLFSDADAKGEHRALAYLGECIYNEDRQESGQEMMKKSIALSESTMGMYFLGKHYIEDATTDVDQEFGVNWLKRSDRYGCLEATFYLGMLYSRCKDEKFKAASISKFLEGAERGDLRCIDRLIKIYDSKDPKRAEHWRQRFREEDAKVCYYEWRRGDSDVS